MLRLTTPCEVPDFKTKMDIRKPVFLSGSCFAEHIGSRLIQDRWRCILNPNGILFNPISVLNSIEQVVSNAPVDLSQLVEINGLNYAWDHHGKFQATEKSSLINMIAQSRTNANEVLTQSEWIILTFGSAWVYELNTSQLVVANCHKAPGDWFSKRLLEVDEITQKAASAFKSLREKKILLTVSPVKYLRDGMHENNLSKSTLLLAIDKLCKQFNNVMYFPSYEIVTDELRDYRFYKEDMLHPSIQAIEYVYEKFEETCIDQDSRIIMSEWRKLSAAMQHKPIHADTSAHKEFRSNMKTKIEKLESLYPFLDLSDAVNFFKA